MRYVKLLNDGELSAIGIKTLGDRKKLLDAFQFMEDTPALSGEQLAAAEEGLQLMRNPEAVTLTKKKLGCTHELLSLLDLHKYAKCFYKESMDDIRYVKHLNEKKLMSVFQHLDDNNFLSDAELQVATETLRDMRDPDILFTSITDLLQSV